MRQSKIEDGERAHHEDTQLWCAERGQLQCMMEDLQKRCLTAEVDRDAAEGKCRAAVHLVEQWELCLPAVHATMKEGLEVLQS